MVEPSKTSDSIVRSVSVPDKSTLVTVARLAPIESVIVVSADSVILISVVAIELMPAVLVTTSWLAVVLPIILKSSPAPAFAVAS